MLIVRFFIGDYADDIEISGPILRFLDVEYDNLDEEIKLEVFKRFDRFFSEKLGIDESDMDLRKFSKISNRFEGLYQFLFYKNQMYEKHCVEIEEFEDDMDSFTQSQLMMSWGKTPISGTSLDDMFKFGNKYGDLRYTDAFLFAYSQVYSLLKLVTKDDVRMSSASYNVKMKFLKDIKEYSDDKNRISNEFDEFDFSSSPNSNILRSDYANLFFNEWDVFDSFDENMADEERKVSYAFIGIKDVVWERMNKKQRGKILLTLNEYFAKEISNCEVKKLDFTNREILNFDDTDEIHLGDISKYGSYKIIQPIIYEYAFEKAKSKVSEFKRDKKEKMLSELRVCEEKYNGNNYSDLKDNNFMKLVNYYAKNYQKLICEKIVKSLNHYVYFKNRVKMDKKIKKQMSNDITKKVR